MLGELPRPARLDRFTGAPRVLLPYAIETTLGIVALLSIFVLADMVMMSDHEALADAIAASGLLLLSGLPSTRDAPFIALLPLIVASSPWIGNFRTLKMLPVGRLRLSALLLAPAVIAGSCLWPIAWVIQLLVLGEPPADLRPDLWLLIVGGTALAQAIGLKSRPLFAGISPVLIGIIFASRILFRAVEAMVPAHHMPLALPLIGGMCLAGAIVLNWHTTTRAASRGHAYRAVRLPMEG